MVFIDIQSLSLCALLVDVIDIGNLSRKSIPNRCICRFCFVLFYDPHFFPLPFSFSLFCSLLFLFPLFSLLFSFPLLFYRPILSYPYMCLKCRTVFKPIKATSELFEPEKFWHKELEIVLFSSRVYSTPLMSTFSSLPISSLLSYPLLLSSFPSDDIVIPYIQVCLALVRQQTSNASRIENSLHALQTMIYSKENSCQSS